VVGGAGSGGGDRRVDGADDPIERERRAALAQLDAVH